MLRCSVQDVVDIRNLSLVYTLAGGGYSNSRHLNYSHNFVIACCFIAHSVETPPKP